MLPPSAIAGVSLVCALGPWAFSEPMVLRALAAAAAITAITGAFVMRRWDMQAGRRVAELTRARASDEWRHEERVAELEADLEESRELRAKLEQRLRAKRAELQGLRNEHAALLRRYATAETERAGALEGRRLLELGAAAPARALAAGRPAAPQGAPAGGTPGTGGAEPGSLGLLSSPQGARLLQRAGAALARLAGTTAHDGGDGGDGGGGVRAAGAGDRAATRPTGTGTQAAAGSARAFAPDAGQGAAPGLAQPSGRQPAGHLSVPPAAAVVPPAPARRPAAAGGFDFFGTKGAKDAKDVKGPNGSEDVRGSEYAQGSEDARGAEGPQGFEGVRPPVPAQAQDRRGTGAGAVAPSALEAAVQNEDLADIVGQEALALHRAEAEAETDVVPDAETEDGTEVATGLGTEDGTEDGAEPGGAGSAGEGRVIDLTAHDETEQIDVQGLRTAAS
ncbi:hypothetical protein [Streptomyces leeuwenhoekii]|nr:hypothetical protein [Streptomyces leeuwenhoekii]